MNFHFLTGRENKELVDYQGYLIHKKALESFRLLQDEAKKDINADLQITSSFRDYDRQEIIWNQKARGLRDILDDHGEKLDFKSLSKNELLYSILRWSALPGASRHHWGSDLDIYDANQIKKEKLQLIPDEYSDSGPMGKLNKWLCDRIKNKNAYGFFKPYQYDFGGINTEPWHLSYSPISELALDNYTIDIFAKNIDLSTIELKDIILNELDSIYNLYIKKIHLPS